MSTSNKNCFFLNWLIFFSNNFKIETVLLSQFDDNNNNKDQLNTKRVS